MERQGVYVCLHVVKRMAGLQVPGAHGKVVVIVATRGGLLDSGAGAGQWPQYL